MSSRHRKMLCTLASNPQLCAIHIGSIKRIAITHFLIARTQKMPNLSPKTHISHSLIRVAGVQSLVSGCATRKGALFTSELINRNLASKVVGTPRIGVFLRLLPLPHAQDSCMDVLNRKNGWDRGGEGPDIHLQLRL